MEESSHPDLVVLAFDFVQQNRNRATRRFNEWRQRECAQCHTKNKNTIRTLTAKHPAASTSATKTLCAARALQTTFALKIRHSLRFRFAVPRSIPFVDAEIGEVAAEHSVLRSVAAIFAIAIVVVAHTQCL